MTANGSAVGFPATPRARGLTVGVQRHSTGDGPEERRLVDR